MSWFDPIGWVEKYVIEPIGDVYTSTRDRIVPILQDLPGGQGVIDAINQGADWVKVVVNMPGADIVLKALAMLAYGPLAQQLGGTAWFGPQIASAVWALPGVVRGQNFFDAWAFEVKDRVERLAQIYGPQALDQIKQYIPDTLRYLNRKAFQEIFPNEFPFIPPGSQTPENLKEGLRRIGLKITPESLSAEMALGRPDIAALALNYIKGEGAALYDISSFDPVSGRRQSTSGERVPLPPRGADLRLPSYEATRDRLPGGISIGDIATVVKPTSSGPRPRSRAMGLLDLAADATLLAGVAGGIYLIARAFSRSRSRSRQRAR